MTIDRWFGTDGIRGEFGSPTINPVSAVHVAYVAGKVLLDHYFDISCSLRVNDLIAGKTVHQASLPDNKQPQVSSRAIVIGRDTRASGPALEHALASGFAAMGLDVFLVGVVPTPLVAQLTRELSAIAGVMVSASHNSYKDNGIKFFDPYGFKIADDIEDKITNLMQQQPTFKFDLARGRVFSLPAHIDSHYRELCTKIFSTPNPLSNMNILVDCANGAFYKLAPEVLVSLGAKVTVVANNPDGENINHECGAVFPQTLRTMMLSHQECQLGFAIDGDGDRVLMADNQGNLYDGDSLLYILATNPRPSQVINGVVGTEMTNLGLEQALGELEIPFVRAAVGDRYVMAALRQRGWQCGGENSGHLLDLGISTTGDALLSALNVLRVVISSGKSLAELTASLKHCQQILVNLPYRNAISLEDDLIQDAVATANVKLGDKGRVLLRFSGTELLVRVMVEGYDEQLNKEALNEVVNAVGKLIAANDN